MMKQTVLMLEDAPDVRAHTVALLREFGGNRQRATMLAENDAEAARGGAAAHPT
jgi:hypothetical protein